MADPQPITPEVYRQIHRFPGYRFSSDGRVESNHVRGRWHQRSEAWHPLNPTPNKDGYLTVRIRDADGRKLTRYVHLLILEAFRGPCPRLMEGRHLDDDPSNNRIDNLEWGLPAENKADRDRNGGTARGERHGRAKLDAPRVRSIRRLAAAGGSPRDIATLAGVDPRAVALILEGKNWSHVGDEGEQVGVGGFEPPAS